MYFHSRSNLIEEVYVIAWSVRIRSFSGPYFPAFGLNTEITDVPSGNYLETQSRVGENIWQRVPNPAPTFYEGRPIYIAYQPFFKFCPNSNSPAFFVALFFWLNVSSRHSSCIILLNDIMILWTWTCSALVP